MNTKIQSCSVSEFSKIYLHSLSGSDFKKLEKMRCVRKIRLETIFNAQKKPVKKWRAFVKKILRAGKHHPLFLYDTTEVQTWQEANH